MGLDIIYKSAVLFSDMFVLHSHDGKAVEITWIEIMNVTEHPPTGLIVVESSELERS